MQTEMRLGTINDVAFVKDSWRRSVQHTYPNQYVLDFAKHFQAHMQVLIDKSVIMVCNLPGDEDEIMSYLIYTSFAKNMVIHFAYTKDGARKQGLVRQLIDMSNVQRFPIIFTHPAKNETIMKHFASKYIYDPSIIAII